MIDGEPLRNGAAQKKPTQQQSRHPRLRRRKEEGGWYLPKALRNVANPLPGVIINLATTTEWSEREPWSQQVTTMTHTHADDWSIDTEVAR